MRKKAGLTISDKVEFYYGFPINTHVQNGHSSVPDENFANIFISQKDYFIDTLGSIIMPIEAKPYGAVVLGEETHNIREEDNLIFTAVITTPVVTILPSALKKVNIHLFWFKNT